MANVNHFPAHVSVHSLHFTSNIIMNSAEAHLPSECASIQPSTLFNYEPSVLHTNVLLGHSYKYSCQNCSLETILNPGIQF
jgi:hypothetical protein